MIDKNTGRLAFGNAKTVSKTTTLFELKAMKLGEVQEEREMGNGWLHYNVRNVEASGSFFLFTFHFYEVTLKSISFVIKDSPFDLGKGWGSWSEQKELEHACMYNNWLNNEIGDFREFTWGNVWAGYDPKSGGSSMIIRYK